jgi:predicted SnoaL-like aldol condensation-catalyzing enzyme
MNRDDMKQVAHRMYAAANAGDIDAIDDIFAADFRSHPMGTTGTGPLKAAWTAIREKYPEMRASVEDMLADGDKLAVRLAVHGTAADPMPALMEIIRIADGRIAELWAVTDFSLR